MVLILVLLSIAALLALDYFVTRATRRAPAEARPDPAPVLRLAPDVGPVGPPDLLERVPAGLFFGPGHTWAQLASSGTLRVGADRFVRTLLGPMDRVEVRRAGTEVQAGDPIASIRSGSRTLSLRSPVAGIVAEVNPDVESDPHLVERDAFGEGWLCWIAPQRLARDLRGLRVAEDALDWIREEARRLRDAIGMLGREGAMEGVTAQDGGLPVDGLAHHLGDEDWNRLQVLFFGGEPSRGTDRLVDPYERDGG